MKTSILQWHAHRLLTDRLRWFRPFSSKHKKLLFISASDQICHAQIFPFYFYREVLKRQYQLEIREVPLACWQSGQHPYKNTDIDAVFFQTWFDVSSEQMDTLVKQIKSSYPQARIAYGDWFAPCDLRYAEVLTPHCEVYVKKQLLKNHSEYHQTLVGDTNLNDYYTRRFNLPQEITHHNVPEQFWDKLIIGPHFAFSASVMPHFLTRYPDRKRQTDLHARIAVNGSPWYSAMRHEALQAVEQLPDSISVIKAGRVSRKQFLQELMDSRLCFSPFGYGEVCWRDFEAMFSGSLLLKPDMSHLECYPDVFIPDETYVSLNWDLSDLEEKIVYYLAHDDEREQICRQAFERLQHYFQSERFLTDMQPLFAKLELTPTRHP